MSPSNGGRGLLFVLEPETETTNGFQISKPHGNRIIDSRQAQTPLTALSETRIEWDQIGATFKPLYIALGRTGIGLLFLLLAQSVTVLAQLSPMPAGKQQTGLPAQLQNVGIDQRLNEQIPLDIVFRDEAGHPVALRQYFDGKPVILTLVYYECPMLCTQVLNGVESSLKLLTLDVGRQFNVVTLSFNPKETPELAAEKKRVYLAAYDRPGAADGWHFLTGDESSIKALSDAVGFRYTYDANTNLYAHASGIILLTPEGKISRYFYGIQYPPTDLRLGLVEASSGKVGSPVDQVLLFCYHYDPSRGKYTVLTMNLLKAGGVAVLAALGILLVALRSMNKRRARYLAEAAPQENASD
jgi:protein SCO1/2